MPLQKKTITRSSWTEERKAAKSLEQLGRIRPGRTDTNASGRFIKDLLMPLLSHLAKAVTLQDTQGLEAVELVSNAQLHQADRTSVRFNLSPTELRIRYGAPALRIWRKAFNMVQRGGRSTTTGMSFNSAWVLKEGVLIRLRRHIERARTGEQPLASGILTALADSAELVNTYVAHRIVEATEGIQEVVPRGAKRLVDLATVRAARARKKTLTHLANLENQGRYDAQELELRRTTARRRRTPSAARRVSSD